MLLAGGAGYRAVGSQFNFKHSDRSRATGSGTCPTPARRRSSWAPCRCRRSPPGSPRSRFERDLAKWQAEYDAALDAARRRLGNSGWQPRCPQQIGVRPRPLAWLPVAIGG
jgi:hypothetical protein